MAQQAAPDPLLDPNSAHVAISTFDFLLIELVPLAERLAREYEASLDRPSLANLTIHSPASAGDRNSNSTNNNGAPASASSVAGGETTIGGGAGGAATVTTYDGLPETEVFKDNVYFRLESLGFRVGQGLSERFSRDKPRFTENLDVIKFVCKDLWGMVFKKQIDNLKTNHRGVYVLTDNKFRPFTRMSMTNNSEAIMRAAPHLYFPCGLIRGVLSSLGMTATVQAETTELPVAVFQIKTAQART